MSVVGLERRVRLIGREEELGVVVDAVEGAATGHAKIVVLDGEAGIGKSRLVAERRWGLLADGDSESCRVRATRSSRIALCVR